MVVGKVNGLRLYTGLWLDYRLRLRAPASDLGSYICIVHYLCGSWASCSVIARTHRRIQIRRGMQLQRVII